MTRRPIRRKRISVTGYSKRQSNDPAQVQNTEKILIETPFFRQE